MKLIFPKTSYGKRMYRQAVLFGYIVGVGAGFVVALTFLAHFCL